jgi:transaldolase
MRKAGAKDYKSYLKKILKMCNNKLVSLEVFADEYKEMKIQVIKLMLGKKCLCKSACS